MERRGWEGRGGRGGGGVEGGDGGRESVGSADPVGATGPQQLHLTQSNQKALSGCLGGYDIIMRPTGNTGLAQTMWPSQNCAWGHHYSVVVVVVKEGVRGVFLWGRCVRRGQSSALALSFALVGPRLGSCHDPIDPARSDLSERPRKEYPPMRNCVASAPGTARPGKSANYLSGQRVAGVFCIVAFWQVRPCGIDQDTAWAHARHEESKGKDRIPAEHWTEPAHKSCSMPDQASADASEALVV